MTDNTTPPNDDESLTRILKKIAEQDPSVDPAQVTELFWSLKKIADRMMRGASPGHTLQATALVNEAYIKVFGGSTAGDWNDRAHFFKVAAAAMRSILVDHARRKGTKKRSAEGHRVDLDAIASKFTFPNGDMLDLEDALGKLEEVDPRAVRIAELSWFAGQPSSEIAKILGVSERTVSRELKFATAFVRKILDDPEDGSAAVAR